MSKDTHIEEKKIRQLHDEAMDLSEEGFFARRQKDEAKATEFFK